MWSEVETTSLKNEDQADEIGCSPKTHLRIMVLPLAQSIALGDIGPSLS